MPCEKRVVLCACEMTMQKKIDITDLEVQGVFYVRTSNPAVFTAFVRMLKQMLGNFPVTKNSGWLPSFWQTSRTLKKKSSPFLLFFPSFFSSCPPFFFLFKSFWPCSSLFPSGSRLLWIFHSSRGKKKFRPGLITKYFSLSHPSSLSFQPCFSSFSSFLLFFVFLLLMWQHEIL